MLFRNSESTSKLSVARIYCCEINTVHRLTTMKYTLALVVLAAVAAVCNSSAIRTSPRANLVSGYVAPGDRLLYRTYVYRAPILNSVQAQDVTYYGNATTRITAVHASEVGSTQYSTAWVIRGGVGWNNVTVRFQSYRGYGYYYLLDIWGR